MPNYIKPDQNSFLLRPSKAHFKGCEILVIVHSAIDSFSMRRGLRDTWIQFVTQKRVANVSVIFLIGNMATPVVEFSREGYKIRKVFAIDQYTYLKEIIEFHELAQLLSSF